MWHLSWKLSLFLVNPLPKRQILDSSKVEDFADDNFKSDENGESYPDG